MKQLRKSLSLLCALTMALTFLSIPALAEEPLLPAAAAQQTLPGRLPA